MTNPLISVIVPNYCHSAYLSQRISSILDQTYQNFELIILDDASPDDGASKLIIEQYRSHPKVRHIEYNESNCGSPFRQWEKGISYATGEWIWIAESDDYCETVFLQTCMNVIIRSSSISYVYCCSRLIDSYGNTKGYTPSAPAGIYDGKDFIRRYMTAGSSVWNASAVVFRKSNAITCINRILDFRAAGDYLFWCLMAETGDVAVLKEPLNCFRQHDEKVTTRSSIDGTEDQEVLQILQYLDKNHYLKGLTRFNSMRHFFHRIFSWNYNDESLRHRLLSQYSEFAFLPVLLYRIEYLCFRGLRFIRIKLKA